MEDITGTHVKIDDLLSKAATMEEVLSIFRKVLIFVQRKEHKTGEAQTRVRHGSQFHWQTHWRSERLQANHRQDKRHPQI